MQIEYRRPPDCFKSALSCVSVYVRKPNPFWWGLLLENTQGMYYPDSNLCTNLARQFGDDSQRWALAEMPFSVWKTILNHLIGREETR